MEQHNPFQPPTARVDDEGPGEELASLGQRLLASIIDAVIGFVFAIPIMMMMGTWSALMSGRASQPSILQNLLGIFLGCLFFLLAHGYFLKTAGQTIGKKLIGIRIVDLSDNLPSFTRLIGARYLPVWLTSAIPFIGGLLVIVDALFIFGSERRCLHDRIAGTKVIRA